MLSQSTAQRIEHWKLADLAPYPKPLGHQAHTQMAGRIVACAIQSPILVNADTVLTVGLRLRATRHIGLRSCRLSNPITENAMRIEMWDIDRPKDYKNNARIWSAQAVAKVGSSIKTYGWRQLVVVDREEVIVIGHLGRTAGKSIGEMQCPVHVADNLTPHQIRGLRLADNRTNQESVWDDELLARELQELALTEFDLSLTGFDRRELEDPPDAPGER